MATWFDDTAVLDGLLDIIRQGSTQVWLIEAYTQGDDYNTVFSNIVADADSPLTVGDFSASQAAGAGVGREMDFLGAAGTATKDSTLHDTPGGAGTGLHIALTNGTDTIYAVTDETSNQPIVDLNPVTFPAFTIRTLQPTQI